MVVFALFIAAFTGALMKKLSVDFSAYQITWFRFLGFVIVLLPVIITRFGKKAFRPSRPGMQVIRGLTMAGGTISFVIGVKTIDFADAVAILYAYPFLLTVLAVLFLKERVKWAGWLGIFGGFLGVLLVMRPEFGAINTGTLFVFLCAVIISVQMVLNRKLGATSHPLITCFWGALIAVLLLSTIVPFHWKPISVDQMLVFIIMTGCGAISQVLLVYGFSKAEASTLAPFTYLEIIASVFLGFLMFGTLPVATAWLGIVLIIVSGLVVAYNLKIPLLPRRNPRI
jgi:drug/metabolite transporter (DMT)-like permease